MFGKKEVELKFSTRADAFAYMLAHLLEKGKDPMDAAKQADEFANIFAVNMGLPTQVEPEVKGIDKYLKEANKIACYCKDNPQLVEFITGALTFAVGAIFGKKESQPEPKPIEKVEFDKID